MTGSQSVGRGPSLEQKSLAVKPQRAWKECRLVAYDASLRVGLSSV